MRYQPLIGHKGGHVVLDTDFCSDCDDVAAIALLCAAAKDHPEEFSLDGVAVNVKGPFDAGSVRASLAHFGMESVPIGVTDDDLPRSGNFSSYRETLAAHCPDYVHDGLTALDLYRDILRRVPDGSLTIISIGFFNNMAAALRDDPELFHRKVRTGVIMAGGFGSRKDHCEFNVVGYLDDAREFVRDFKGRMLFVGFECGVSIKTDLTGLPEGTGNFLLEAFAKRSNDAMRHPSWDPITVDLALHGEDAKTASCGYVDGVAEALPGTDGCYAISEPGFLEFAEDGRTIFNEAADGNVRHLIFTAPDEAVSARISRLIREAAGIDRIPGGCRAEPARPANVYAPWQPDRLFTKSSCRISLVPSIECAPKSGRLWATWYTGMEPAENHLNYCVLAASDDGGDTWRELLVSDPVDPACRTFDPEVWIAPDGLLRWTWAERLVGAPADGSDVNFGTHNGVETDVLMSVTLSPDEDPPYPPPAPAVIGHGVMMCKPTVLADGTWLYPIAKWNAAPSATFVATRDCGATFEEVGGATIPVDEREFDEHQVIQLADGSLRCLIRAKKSGLYEARSTDGGRTWGGAIPSPLGHVNARLFIRRLASGALLLVKHGAIGERPPRRERLMAFISRDDGATWQGGLMLDARPGVSYPDGCQKPDGTILIAYDYGRTTAQAIHFCEFTEEDAAAGRDVSGRVRLARSIYCAGSH